jgi:hypothetical protein
MIEIELRPRQDLLCGLCSCSIVKIGWAQQKKKKIMKRRINKIGNLIYIAPPSGFYDQEVAPGDHMESSHPLSRNKML